jgi:two-component system CheB/CheR fusion protein
MPIRFIVGHNTTPLARKRAKRESPRVQPAGAPDAPPLPPELYEELAAGVFVTAPPGDVLAVNRIAADMLGYAREELLGKNIAAFSHPEDVARRMAVAVFRPGETLRDRRRLLHKNGHYVVAEGRARVLDDGRIVCVVNDVTASVAAERALSESAEQLQFVADAVPALIAYVDRDARYVWGNESYHRWFGQAPAKLRGRHVSEVLGASAWATVRPYIERALAGETVTFEQRLVYKSGPARDVRATYVPHFDGEGRVRGFVGMIHDIGEMRDAEQALRRSEHLLERSQSAAHVGSWEMTIGDDGRFEPGSLRWSNEIYRIFGYEPGAVEASPELFFGSVHAEDRDAIRAASAAGVRLGQPFEKEYRLVRPDGTVRFLHAWTDFEEDADGRRHLIGTCQDITERKRAEHERERALEELREADRRKDEFLAMLAHELRNPLAPILNAVEVLDHADPADQELTSTFRTVIARQVEHMKRLLDDLLDVSRVSQGKIQLRKQSVDLGALLLQAVEVSRPMIVEKQQQLSLTLAHGPLPLEADPTRVVQVFANIVNNAAKYTDPGGHIWLSVGTEGGEAVVRVRDDGMGMSPELLSRAFDLFVQETRSLDRAQGGLGIGLTMVRTLVKLHGGSVRALSDGPGRGSELVVRLPLTPGAKVAPAPSAREAPAAVPAAASLRVLVVDDNVDAARALGHLLKLLGHEVALAHDGPAALAAAAAAPPELVLLDIGLPGMDGYAVAERLRAAGHGRAALVALTGYGQDEHLRRSASAGFDHHLIKPVNLGVLRKITADVRAGAARGGG